VTRRETAQEEENRAWAAAYSKNKANAEKLLADRKAKAEKKRLALREQNRKRSAARRLLAAEDGVAKEEREKRRKCREANAAAIREREQRERLERAVRAEKRRELRREYFAANREQILERRRVQAELSKARARARNRERSAAQRLLEEQATELIADLYAELWRAPKARRAA
jgi:colicin import membrane protein